MRVVKPYERDKSVSPEVFALVKKLESVVVAKKFTIDGEVFVCKRGDTPFELPLEVEPFGAYPIGFKERHRRALHIMHMLVEDIRGLKRHVPPTRSELIERGIPKKDLEKLEGWGFVKSAVIPLQAATPTDGTTMALKPRPIYCVYYTNQGRALVRELFDPKYGREGDVHWDGVRDAADAIRAAEANRSAGDKKAEGDSGEVQH